MSLKDQCFLPRQRSLPAETDPTCSFPCRADCRMCFCVSAVVSRSAAAGEEEREGVEKEEEEGAADVAACSLF